MKHLSDLTSYNGELPYASEFFGIYQPLLGWKSGRTIARIEDGANARLGELLGRARDLAKPDYSVDFLPQDCAVNVERLEPAHSSPGPRFSGLTTTEVSRALPPHDAYTPAVWDQVLQPDFLRKVLQEEVAPRVAQTYHEICSAGADDHDHRMVARAEEAARTMLAQESRAASLLLTLGENRQYRILEAAFYNVEPARALLWATISTVYDPFAAIDPTTELGRVGLSPVGVAHLFRQYFFELDTFLGPPVGHVWMSPGSTVELVEVHTRRTLVEQSVEQSLESIRKTEKSLTQQDELADAVKDENRSGMKLGVSVSANERWGWGSANESASFGYDTTQQHAREQTHKTMRQQSEKLSTEIKENFKTTFRTVTETTDLSSKRYVLANSTAGLLNYELRRKMRHLAVQVQDVGSYLCWQTYVDDPGKTLGVSRLVHIGVPPDLSKVPNPEMVVPPPAFSEDVTISIPFIPVDDAANDETYNDGDEETSWFGDATNHIQADVDKGPFACSQSGFALGNVTVEGANAVLTVDPTSIREAPTGSGKFWFKVHLKRINFNSTDSVPAQAKLRWEPSPDHKAIDAENAKRLEKFTAREREVFLKAFLEEARDRIKLASNLQPRRAEDLREEERIVVYRALIQEMLAPKKLIPQPDPQTQHVVAELLDSIFDVDKLLYFVAPEWWRPLIHHSHQQLGNIDTITDVKGNKVASPQVGPEEDVFAWGERYSRWDNYYVTEDSAPARLGSSLGWLMQLDGDELRNAFLNAHGSRPFCRSGPARSGRRSTG